MVKYFAHHRDALVNGSFFRYDTRIDGKCKVAHYNLGDFMGYTEKVPDALQEFPRKEAEKLIGKINS